MKEVYKPIKDFEGKYEISNFGNVKSLARRVRNTTRNTTRELPEIILSPKVGTSGYLEVTLNTPTYSKTKRIHRLIAEHFLPLVEDKNVINHKDGNKLNNSISNLEWVTQAENAKHAFDTGLNKSSVLSGSKGSKHPNTVLTEKLVLKIRNSHSVIRSIKNLVILYPEITKSTLGKIVYRQTWKHI